MKEKVNLVAIGYFILGWSVTASGDIIFNSTSFNEGKGDYQARCYYTDITNVEQHLLRWFLSAWMGEGQPLSNWTFDVFDDENETGSQNYDGDISESIDDEDDNDREDETEENVQNDTELQTQNTESETETVDKVQQPASQSIYQPVSTSSNDNYDSNNVSYGWPAPNWGPPVPNQAGYWPWFNWGPPLPNNASYLTGPNWEHPGPSQISYLPGPSWRPPIPSQTSYLPWSCLRPPVPSLPSYLPWPSWRSPIPSQTSYWWFCW